MVPAPKIVEPQVTVHKIFKVYENPIQSNQCFFVKAQGQEKINLDLRKTEYYYFKGRRIKKIGERQHKRSFLNLTRLQARIIELRYGRPPDFYKAPLRSISEVTKLVGTQQHYVKKFLRNCVEIQGTRQREMVRGFWDQQDGFQCVMGLTKHQQEQIIKLRYGSPENLKQKPL